MRRILPLLVLVSCNTKTAADAPDDYLPLLTTLTDDQVSPRLATLVSTSDALAAALRAFESSATPDDARTAWRKARAAYRALDVAHLGPIDSLGITQAVDAAPLRSADIESYAGMLDAASIAAVGNFQKGWLAVEYVVFASDVSNARKRTYARLCGEEIAALMHKLQDAWATGYAETAKGAGDSQKTALDNYVAGVAFGLEYVVGVRLAQPLGRKAQGTPLPSADVTPLSDSALADMSASIDTFAAMYQSFSPHVRTSSAELDDLMTSQIAACLTKIQAIPKPFVTAVSTSTQLVQDAYDACKVMKATWNTDITHAIGATPYPSSNDGD